MEYLRKILVEKGYQVAVAKDGAEGLAIIRKRTPTLVISDILMPVMDGFQMCYEIKHDEALKGIPVILLTSLTEPEDILRGLDCRGDSFVTKPYDEQYLLKRINYILANLEFRKSERWNVGVEIKFGGKTHVIDSDRRQILDLLLSTFEAAVQKNHELIKTQHELKMLNVQLEDKIMERTRELMASKEQLQFLAHHDVITKLPNRGLFTDRLCHALTRAPWHKQTMAVLFVDLDHFKQINDTLGHHIGDLLLKAVAKRLTNSVREGDTVARYGGDEFTIILTDIAQVQDVPMVTQKILDSFSTSFVLEGHDLHITASVGISVYPYDGKDAETLLKKADSKMYIAKEQRRNACPPFPPDLHPKLN